MSRTLFALALTSALSFGTMVSAESPLRTLNDVDTSVGTSVDTMQNTGITAGANSRFNGSLMTGSNTSNTAVSTDVRNRTASSGTSGRSRTGLSTNVGTAVSTTQDSGLSFGDNARVNGSVITGSNRANTAVGTSVDNNVSTDGVRDAVNNRTSIATDAKSRMETLQNTGVMIGKDGRINSNIVTGDNESNAAVGTSVSNRVSNASDTGRKMRRHRERDHDRN